MFKIKQLGKTNSLRRIYLQYIFLSFLFTLLMCFHSACNKYSNELPIVTTQEETFSQTKHINGKNPFIETQFFRYTSKDGDSVSVQFKNLSTTDLSNLQIVIEFCADNENYDGCKILFNKTLTLSKNNTSERYAISKEGNTYFDSKHYNVYVVNASMNATHPISGYFSNQYSWFGNDSTIQSFPQLYGFIEIDGHSVFRLKSDNTHQYNVPNGRFIETSHFLGALMNADQIISYLRLYDDSSSVKKKADGVYLHFKLDKALSDSSNNLVMNLLKN